MNRTPLPCEGRGRGRGKPPIDLSRLITAINATPHQDAAGINITGIAYDSRRVQQGALFIAVPGFHVDGHDFVRQAGAAGAAAVVVRHGRAADFGKLSVPVLAVEDTRVALSAAAAEFYGHPGRAMRVIGVTGTDGKTTTTYLISALLESAGKQTGLIGTVDFKVGPEWRHNDTRQTTPEALEVQQLLAEMRDAGVTHAVVESSSHGLELRKLDHCAYDVAVVTNVGQDHLELHGTPDAYLAAKGRLFAFLDDRAGKPATAAGIVNADDVRSAEYMRSRTHAPILSYGIDAVADVRADDLFLDASGASFILTTPTGSVPVRIQLPGRFNVSNALAAATVALVEGVDLPVIAAGLTEARGVPGRMERIDAGQPFTVIVDYAHTGPAFEKVLRTLRPLTSGRIITVFGCAGGRSPERRPGMGGVAAYLSGFSILTNEDPHEEDPRSILDDIAAAMRAAGRREDDDFTIVEDRRNAIRTAFALARPGDVVLLAGKGHEQSIIVGRTKHPWDERTVALQ
ncbi:MAG: UDP-N-acetylmuramoyl-L-alanyl-D-glutamate--2,6-diaminopimelate ligase, partial [Dehalococcoidia bacterium]